MDVGFVELLFLAAFLVAPLVYGARLAQRPDPRPVSAGLLAVATLMAAATFALPLFYLLAVPVGGMIVGRGNRAGWAIMALAAVALVARVVLYVGD